MIVKTYIPSPCYKCGLNFEVVKCNPSYYSFQDWLANSIFCPKEVKIKKKVGIL